MRTLLAAGSGRPPHHDTNEVTFLPSLLTRSKIRIAALQLALYDRYAQMRRTWSRSQDPVRIRREGRHRYVGLDHVMLSSPARYS